MNSDDKKFIICIIMFATIAIGGYASLSIYSGFSTPFSVVMSQSMQHDDDRSEIGCIDTGDIVIIREPDKCQIQSYVEGTKSGYTTFGDYGSVIIYNRDAYRNPVIHRAILWLEYNQANDCWSAPSLAGFEGTWYWKHNGTTSNDMTQMRGILYFEDLTASKKDVQINLESSTLKNGGSGYITMGDNPNNSNFDQSSSIINHLIDKDDIRSIPVFEIPWIGAVKILLKNDGDNLEHVPNSIPSLAMALTIVIGAIVIIDMLYTRRDSKKDHHDTESEDEINNEDGD